MAERDLYILDYTDWITIKGSEQKVEDFALVETPAMNQSSLSGNVIYPDGVTEITTPIIVSLFSEDYVPIAHVEAEKSLTLSAHYEFLDIAAGNFIVAASTTGYQSAFQEITIVIGENTVNLELNEYAQEIGTIYGFAYVYQTGTPAVGKTLRLMKEIIESGETKRVEVSRVLIPADGEYHIRVLEAGTYYLEGINIYSEVKNPTTAFVFTGESFQSFDNTTVELYQHPEPLATISGIVKDSTTQLPIAGATVLLYVYENEEEILDQWQYTDSKGRYVFSNLVERDYLVKSKVVGTYS